MKAEIIITLKEAVRDPQGQAIAKALDRMGFAAISKVRQGKHIEIELNHQDKEQAHHQIQSMCEKFLVNPVIEDYQIVIDSH